MSLNNYLQGLPSRCWQKEAITSTLLAIPDNQASHTVVSASEIELMRQHLLHKLAVICVLQIRMFVGERALPKELKHAAVPQRVEISAHHQRAFVSPACQ